MEEVIELARAFEIAESLAEKAAQKDEVPVGALILKDGKVISEAFNLKEHNQNVLGHAELIAIQEATRKLGSWRLEDCEMVVTLEPCPMCLGAIQQARIAKVYYGAKDPKGGALSLGYHIHTDERLNHRFSVEFIPRERSGAILTEFFSQKRKANKKKLS